VTLISADVLRAYIAARGLTHEALARRAACSRGFVSQLAVGKRKSCTAELAGRLAEALEVPVSALFVTGDPERAA
jgi:transcriptional regulator with XRE-family HTH domain